MPFILIHSIFIIFAFFLALAIFKSPKGSKYHKLLGWLFFVCMMISVLTTIWILPLGDYSFVHLLSIATFYFIIKGIYSIRFKPNNYLHQHAISMCSAFFAIIVAGVGVMFKHYIMPHNTLAGNIASVIVVIIGVPIMSKTLKKYKRNLV